MKKITKKLLLMIAALGVAFGTFAAAGVSAEAATVPSRVRITPNVFENNAYQANPKFEGSWDQGAILVKFDTAGDKIKNIKTNNKKLEARQVYEDTKKNALIGLWSAEEGTYTLKFDVVNSAGVKVSSHKVKVYCKEDKPYKYVKFRNKPIEDSFVTKKTSGTLSLKMAEGYKFVKIVVTTYDQNGKKIKKEYKNNKRIGLGKYPYYAVDKKGWTKHINIQTDIKIYYIDRYTKEECYTQYYINRIRK